MRPRIPVDYLFPTLCDMLHRAIVEELVAEIWKMLKEAIAVARYLTSEQAANDHKAGAATLQPGDIVIFCTDKFVGKWKVKNWWEDGGFMVVHHLEDWPIYKVKCLPTGNKHKPQYLRIKHNLKPQSQMSWMPPLSFHKGKQTQHMLSWNSLHHPWWLDKEVNSIHRFY